MPRKRHPKRSSRRNLVGFPSRFNPLPFILDAEFETVFTCSVAAGNVLDNAASINVSSFPQPLNNVSYTFTNTATGSTPFGGVATLGTNIGNNPIGYSFASANYAGYRVLSYDLHVTSIPQGSGDTLATALVPTGSQELPASGFWNYYKIGGQNVARTGVAQSGANSSLNILRVKSNPYAPLGFTRQQWLAIPQTAIGSSPSVNSYVVFFAGTLDGSSNASACVFMVRLRQRIRLSDPIQFAT